MTYYTQTCNACFRIKPCMGGLCDDCAEKGRENMKTKDKPDLCKSGESMKKKKGKEILKVSSGGAL